MKKSLPLAALMGATSLVSPFHDADAARSKSTFQAILVSVTSYSPNGSAALIGSLDTSTWTFDPGTGTAVQTGGAYSRLMKVGATPLMRHTMTGVTLGSGAPTGATWACLEGNFGTTVGASICGNYNYGTNLTNQSVYTPTTTGSTVLIGGDDGVIGTPQSLAGSYSNMATTSLATAGQFCLSNSNATVAASRCTAAGSTATAGYDFLFQKKPNGKKK